MQCSCGWSVVGIESDQRPNRVAYVGLDNRCPGPVLYCGLRNLASHRSRAIPCDSGRCSEIGILKWALPAACNHRFVRRPAIRESTPRHSRNKTPLEPELVPPSVLLPNFVSYPRPNKPLAI